MLNILLLLLGFVILVYGANWLVDGASSLAKHFNIPNIVIGLTIVAFGTSSPELVVNVFASVNHQSAIVLGNIVGSNIFNILATLGVCAIIYPLTVKSNTTWIEIPLALLSAVIVLVIANDAFLDGSTTSVISRIDGIILIFFFIIFMVYNIRLMNNDQSESQVSVKEFSVSKSILFIVGGLAGLVFGGRFIVDSASELARAMGISERIIGLTIVSIGTSAPELATSVSATMKKNVDIAIGNIVGSNIFNVFLVLGVSAIVYPVSVPESSNYDLFVNVLASLLLFIFIFTGGKRKLEKWEGSIFVALYVLYLLSLIFY